VNFIAVVLIASLASTGPAVDTTVPAAPVAPSEADQLRGKELFDNGYRLFQEGSYGQAIQAFRLAYSTSGDPTLLYNIALAAERAGEYDLALAYLQEYRVYAPQDEMEALAEKAESFRKRKLKAQLEARPDDARRAVPPDDGAVAGSRSSEREGQPPRRETRIFGPAAAAFTAVAAASFATGLGLGLAARARNRDADASCREGDAGRLCAADADADLRTSRRLALGTDVVIGIGSAAVLGLIIVLATNAARRKKAGRSDVALTPVRIGAGAGWRF
jgi:tetratricopeptide (TPR) repeat protein